MVLKGILYLTKMAPTGQQYDSKSGQWLGSTLDSSGEAGTILVRYKIPLSTITLR
jgi:hypothetical protein